MSDRVFRVDFYPQDWLVDTARLAPDECGMFIQICALMYARRGPVDDDPAELSRKLADCSIRKARALIGALEAKGFLQVRDGFITQKRVENELKAKRNFIETSAKGGRNSGETRRQTVKNKDLARSEGGSKKRSPSHPNPPHPDKDQDHRKSHPPDLGHPKVNGYSILDELDHDGLEDSRIFASAAGQDLNNLAKVFNNGIATGILDRPRDPNKAFVKWIQRITEKGKKR